MHKIPGRPVGSQDVAGSDCIRITQDAWLFWFVCLVFIYFIFGCIGVSVAARGIFRFSSRALRCGAWASL